MVTCACLYEYYYIIIRPRTWYILYRTLGAGWERGCDHIAATVIAVVPSLVEILYFAGGTGHQVQSFARHKAQKETTRGTSCRDVALRMYDTFGT